MPFGDLDQHAPPDRLFDLVVECGHPVLRLDVLGHQIVGLLADRVNHFRRQLVESQ